MWCTIGKIGNSRLLDCRPQNVGPETVGPHWILVTRGLQSVGPQILLKSEGMEWMGQGVEGHRAQMLPYLDQINCFPLKKMFSWPKTKAPARNHNKGDPCS